MQQGGEPRVMHSLRSRQHELEGAKANTEGDQWHGSKQEKMSGQEGEMGVGVCTQSGQAMAAVLGLNDREDW